MSKIKIYFDNENYQIDESSFSDAYSKLQSHLSNVMNGSGATIKFGNTYYNIDSTKLQNATNDFTSYLRTIAGNGRKVVVNGVEYSVDSGKVANSVAELKAVLGNSNSDDGDGLNEYGFYFGKKYAYQGENEYYYIFYSDGVIEEGMAHGNTVKYKYYLNSISDLQDFRQFDVYDNGTVIRSCMNGQDYVLEGTPKTGINEYGFYFDEYYAWVEEYEENGTKIQSISKYKFYEDGTYHYVSCGKYNNAIYDKNEVTIFRYEEPVTCIFSSNGMEFNDSWGDNYTLVE